MTMTVHKRHFELSSDVAIAAENALHDRGAISIVNSDSMGMGRIGEATRRMWQLAHVQAGLAGETGPELPCNARVLRYLAKITLNPAIAHGMQREAGSLAPGRLADIVLWQPAWFGAQPELVIKSGFVAWGASGSGSGSTRLTQPRSMGPFFGGLGGAPRKLALVFVSERCLEDPKARDALPGGVRYAAIRDSRGLGRGDMVANTATPRVEVPKGPEPVLVDGVAIAMHHARSLPLTRVHHLA